MTLVYAKIMGICVCGAEPRGGGGGAGAGGYLEMYTSGSNTQMAVCRGCRGAVCTYVQKCE